MGTDLQTITILAVGFLVACGAGYIAERLKLSPILGYLIGGFVIGPNSPGIVVNQAVTDQLALIGITLLMFAVGLNFDWSDLFKVKRIVLPGAIALSILSIACGTALGIYQGESLLAGFVIGLAICVSSTVVIVRLLTDRQLIHSQEGHIVMGWTLVEDLISIFGLILLPALALSQGGEGHLLLSVGYALLKILLLALFVHYIGGRIVEELLKAIARQKSHELFTLAILASVFTIAVGSAALFGVSIALGAFIAGTVVGKTKLSHQAAANALPMRDAFSVIFFLSVGMLFNPPAILNNLPFFLLLLSIILLFRPLAGFCISKCAGLSHYTAATIAIAIGQIGEYSFILAEEGSRLQILPDTAYDLIVAAAFVSIGLSPLLFQLLSPHHFAKKADTLPEKEIPQSFLPKAVVIGYGPVGKAASEELSKTHSVIIIDQNIDTVISHIGAEILLFGDARQLLLLERAGAANAQVAVVSTPDWRVNLDILTTLQEMNPYTQLIVRAHSERDLERLSDFDIPIVCDEAEAARKMRAVIRSQFKQQSAER